jgi:hypothetical protein
LHAIFHRALAPQTIAHAWLVLTVALTFGLAVAHSAIAAGPSVAPVGPSLVGGAIADAPVRSPLSGPGATTCGAASAADQPRAIGLGQAALHPSACPTRPAAADRANPDVERFTTPAARRGGDALAAIYGGAGPHGPPGARLPLTTLLPGVPPTTGLDLVLPAPSAAASMPSAPAHEVTNPNPVVA